MILSLRCKTNICNGISLLWVPGWLPELRAEAAHFPGPWTHTSCSQTVGLARERDVAATGGLVGRAKYRPPSSPKFHLWPFKSVPSLQWLYYRVVFNYSISGLTNRQPHSSSVATETVGSFDPSDDMQGKKADLIGLIGLLIPWVSSRRLRGSPCFSLRFLKSRQIVSGIDFQSQRLQIHCSC